MSARELLDSTGLLKLNVSTVRILQTGTVTWNSSGGSANVVYTAGELLTSDLCFFTLTSFTSFNSNTQTAIKVTQPTNTQFSFTPVSTDFRGSIEYVFVRQSAPVANETL